MHWKSFPKQIANSYYKKKTDCTNNVENSYSQIKRRPHFQCKTPVRVAHIVVSLEPAAFLRHQRHHFPLGLGGQLVEPGTLGKKLRFCGIWECVNCDKWWQPVGRLRVSTANTLLPCWKVAARRRRRRKPKPHTPWFLTLGRTTWWAYIYRGSAESAMHGCHVTPNPPAYQPVEMRILYICTHSRSSSWVLMEITPYNKMCIAGAGSTL